MKKRKCLVCALLSLVVCLSTLGGCSMNNVYDSSYNKILDRITTTSRQSAPLVTESTTVDTNENKVTEHINETAGGLSSKIDKQELLDIVLTNISDFNTHFVIEGDIESDDVGPVVTTIFFVHPEYFWITGGFEANNKKGLQLDLNLETKSGYSIEQYKAMSTVLSMKVNEIAEAVDPNWSDYDKVLYIHDYIINNTDYNYEDAAIDNTLFFNKE